MTNTPSRAARVADAQTLAVLFGALWLTSLVMFGRPPTVTAHLLMAGVALAVLVVRHDPRNPPSDP